MHLTWLIILYKESKSPVALMCWIWLLTLLASPTHAHVWLTSLEECLDKDRSNSFTVCRTKKGVRFLRLECKKSRPWEKGLHVATCMRDEDEMKERRYAVATWEEEDLRIRMVEFVGLKTLRTTFFTHPVNEINAVWNYKRSCQIALFSFTFTLGNHLKITIVNYYMKNILTSVNAWRVELETFWRAIMLEWVVGNSTQLVHSTCKYLGFPNISFLD